MPIFVSAGKAFICATPVVSDGETMVRIVMCAYHRVHNDVGY